MAEKLNVLAREYSNREFQHFVESADARAKNERRMSFHAGAMAVLREALPLIERGLLIAEVEDLTLEIEAMKAFLEEWGDGER